MGLLALALLGSLANAQQGAGQRRSLEDLLRTLRQRANERTVQLEAPLRAAMEAIEGVGYAERGSEIIRHKNNLVAMGLPLAPLLVPYLEPGDESKGGKITRAGVAADTLIELASPAVTDQLLEAAARGSTTNRLMALRVLGQSPEPDRVAPQIQELYRRSTGLLQRATLECLALLKSEEASKLVGQALNDADIELAKTALEALAKTGNRQAQGLIQNLIKSPRGTKLVEPILGYLAVVPESLADDKDVLSLVQLASNSAVSYQDRIRVLDHLREYDDLDFNRSARKLVDSMADDAREEVSESALATLARHKDRRARNRLLEPYDDRVEHQPNWASSYTARGNVYERIGDWSSAVSDFRESLRREKNPRNLGPVYEGIARCLARQKKYSKAAEYIRESSLTFDERRSLALDPAFRAMLETKYASAFRLND